MIGLDKAKEDTQEVERIYLERGRKALASYLGINYGSVGHVLKRLGMLRGREEAGIIERDRVSCRNPFVEWNEEAAYLLGYFLGDGSLGWNKTKWYAVWDSSEEQVMKEIARIFELEVTKPDYRVQVCDQSVCRILRDWGLVPRKSEVGCLLAGVDLDKNLNHLVRGLFDSDGSVYLGNGGATLTVDIFGHPSYVDQVVGEMPIKMGEGWAEKLRRRSLYRTSHVRVFYLWLYDGATIYLKRKKEVFDEYYRRKL